MPGRNPRSGAPARRLLESIDLMAVGFSPRDASLSCFPWDHPGRWFSTSRERGVSLCPLLSIDHILCAAREFLRSRCVRACMEENAHALHQWAHRTFSHAQLGHRSRTRRLVAMAAQLARGPAGTVTASFPDSAQREGAFRWLASREVSVRGVTEAMGAAAFAGSRRRAYCAVDGTSM